MASENLQAQTPAPRLARRLGLFDATMIVMGGIVGSGIFINPYVVARQVHTPVLTLGAWVADRARRSFYLCRARRAPPPFGWPVRLPAGSLSSSRSIWLGAPAGHTDGRNGGGCRNFRPLLPGPDSRPRLRCPVGHVQPEIGRAHV